MGDLPMEDNYACVDRCPVLKQAEDQLCQRIRHLSEECNYWQNACFMLSGMNVEKLMTEPPKPIVLQLPKDSDVQSLINAINKKETQIVPSHPVFWTKQWKCLNCGKLIDLPEMTDVCDYKYCPYCSAKNTICNITMEEIHIKEGDNNETEKID